MFDFFYGNEAEQYQFYRVPQALFTENQFVNMSCESKLLYGFLLDRCGISRKNEWYEEDGRLFVYFKQEEACEKLNIGKDKAVKIFNELEKIGLICRKKQGQGKPIKIFVCNFARTLQANNSQTPDVEQNNEVKTSEKPKSEEFQVCNSSKTEVKTSEKPKSKHLKNRSPYSIYKYNNILKSQTEMNHTQSIYQGSLPEQKSDSDGWTDEDVNETEDYIKSMIDYQFLIRKFDSEVLELLVDIILEAYNPNLSEIQIQGQNIPRQIVHRQFEKLDSSHIEYVLESLKKQAAESKIKNFRSYLRTCLYNAPYTMNLHYDTEFEYDTKNGLLPHWGKS